MGQLLNVTLPDGRVVQPADWTTAEGLYSTVEFGTGGFTTLDAFSYGLNGTVQGSPTGRQATLADTNLQGEGGILPPNEAMLIRSIAVEMYAIPGTGLVMSDADNVIAPDIGLRNMLRIQRDLLVTLSIASVKEYIRVPISWTAAGSGPHSPTAGGAGASGLAGYLNGNNGGLGINDQRQLASPLFINGGETFRVRITAPTGSVAGLAFTLAGATASARIRTRIHLLGDHKRPVA
jgi:hypothetical protein